MAEYGSDGGCRSDYSSQPGSGGKESLGLAADEFEVGVGLVALHCVHIVGRVGNGRLLLLFDWHHALVLGLLVDIPESHTRNGQRQQDDSCDGKGHHAKDDSGRKQAGAQKAETNQSQYHKHVIQ